MGRGTQSEQNIRRRTNTGISRLDGVPTRVVGSTFRGRPGDGQAAMEELQQLGSRGPRTVNLVPEPTNTFDSDAIQVTVDLEGSERILGYVQNSETRCRFCSRVMPLYPRKGCVQCGRTDALVRQGLAAQLSEELRRDPRLYFYGEITGVGGGSGEKERYGLNFIIRAVLEPNGSSSVQPYDPKQQLTTSEPENLPQVRLRKIQIEER